LPSATFFCQPGRWLLNFVLCIREIIIFNEPLTCATA
jgi:hypothetical protein